LRKAGNRFSTKVVLGFTGFYWVLLGFTGSISAAGGAGGAGLAGGGVAVEAADVERSKRSPNETSSTPSVLGRCRSRFKIKKNKLFEEFHF